MKKQFRSFEDARKFVHSLNLLSRTYWEQYSKSGKKPLDIPVSPQSVYKNKGWKGWGDFLGTGNIAKQLRTYRSFDDARKFARDLSLRSGSEWKKLAKHDQLPEDIPKRPEKIYQTNWNGWKDWLGYKELTFWLKDWISFDNARKFSHSLKLESKSEWKKYCEFGKKPSNIPHTPELVYKKYGWKGWQDWLGYDKPRTSASRFHWRYFDDARELIHKQKLENLKQWLKFCESGKKPKNIPKYPDAVYKNKGWIGWSDWLGNGNIPNKDRKYWIYDDAVKYIRKLNLKNQNDWIAYRKSRKLPSYIPSVPWRVYENKGWIGLWHWLGTEKPKNYKKDYLSYDESKLIITKFKIIGKNYWSGFCKSGKKPKNIPSSPDRIYKNKGWKGWGDFLGTGIISNKNRTYIPFEQTKDFAQKLKLTDKNEWSGFCKSGKKPKNIPSSPDRIYKNKGWKGWGDFLGTGNISNVNKSKNYLKFTSAKEEARKLAMKYDLRTWNDWIRAVKEGKIPSHLPQRPDKIYVGKKTNLK